MALSLKDHNFINKIINNIIKIITIILIDQNQYNKEEH